MNVILIIYYSLFFLIRIEITKIYKLKNVYMAVGKKREKQKTAKYIDEEIQKYNSNKVVSSMMSLDQIKYNKKFKNPKQKELYNSILKNRITFISGPAGTGKSYIALMAAIECLLNPKYNISKLQMTKPIIEAARSIGFLKGNLEDKTGPYFESFYDNISKLIGKQGLKYLKENEYILEAIINFVRGNTFGEYDSLGNPVGYVCILDEAQNLTVSEIKTYISRMGDEDTKLIILGDIDQMDIKLKPGEQNGLEWCFEHLDGIDGITFYTFDEDDIVRSKILIDIMKRFKMFS